MDMNLKKIIFNQQQNRFYKSDCTGLEKLNQVRNILVAKNLSLFSGQLYKGSKLLKILTKWAAC